MHGWPSPFSEAAAADYSIARPVVPGRSSVAAAEAPAEGARRRDPPVQRLPGLVQAQRLV